MGGLPASPSEVLRTMAGVGGPKHLGGSATDAGQAEVAKVLRKVAVSELFHSS